MRRRACGKTSMGKKDSILQGHKVDPEKMPEIDKENLGRLIFREVRKYFSDPAVQADYLAWREEYRKTHPAQSG